MRVHPFFFQLEFPPEGDEDENYGEETAPFSTGYCGTNEGQEQTGIDGVANDGIRTCYDEFVVVFHGDRLAPVLSEVVTRPNGKKQTGGGQSGTQPEAPHVMWEKSVVK